MAIRVPDERNDCRYSNTDRERMLMLWLKMLALNTKKLLSLHALGTSEVDKSLVVSRH
jgi:hypothetical protein